MNVDSSLVARMTLPKGLLDQAWWAERPIPSGPYGPRY